MDGLVRIMDDLKYNSGIESVFISNKFMYLTE